MKKLFQKLTLLSVVGITGGTLASCVNDSPKNSSEEPEEAVVELDKNYKADRGCGCFFGLCLMVI